MALTVTTTRLPGENPTLSDRGRLTVRSELTLAGTYATNGHAYSNADLGLTGYSVGEITSIVFLDPMFRNGTASVVPAWDRTNLKIMFFNSTTGAPSNLLEVANTASLASFVGRVSVTFTT